MSIHYDKQRKTYYVCWRESNKETGQTINRRKRGFNAKKEARIFEDSIINIKKYASFNTLKDLYLNSLMGYSSKDTINAKKRMLEIHCKTLLPMNVRDIKKQDMLSFKNEVLNLNRSLSVKNRIIQTVKAVSKFGYEYYDFPNFANILKSFPKTSDDIKERGIISPDDFKLIIDNCDNKVFKNFYIFLYHTSMRRGEAMALLKSDIRGKHVDLNKSIRRPNQGFRPLKNIASKRNIIIDDIAYEAIKLLLKTEGDFVFGEYEALSPTSISRKYDKTCKNANLPHYRIHDLRYSSISNAILNGIDIVTVSRYVGHSDIETTLNRYSHLLKDSEKRMIDKLNSRFFFIYTFFKFSNKTLRRKIGIINFP